MLNITILDIIVVIILLGVVFSFIRSRRRIRQRRNLYVIMGVILLFVYYINIMRRSIAQIRGEHRLPKQIFILAGQSNMAGRGGLVKRADEVEKVWDVTQLNEFEKSLTISDGIVKRLSADMQWIPAVEPMHQDIDVKKTCGIGPGLIFARFLRKSSNSAQSIGLIPCAIGGTKISEWSRTSILYTTMLKRVIESNAISNVQALLWYQGESDCLDLSDAEVYYERLKEFVLNIRTDLKKPNLLIIMVAVWALDRSITTPFAESHIRPAIFKLGEEDPYVGVVDAEGSAFLDDHIHLTSESQHMLARKLVVKYLEMNMMKTSNI